MITFETKLSGNLAAALDRFEAKVKQQTLLSGVAKAAEVMRDEVLLNATRGGPTRPDRQSGDLEKSIYRAYVPERSTGERKVYVVGARNSDAFYWRFLEFGSSKMAAQPFLRPSLSKLPAALEAGKQRMAERARGK